MIDVPAALRCKLDDDKTTLTWKDAVLYALGVGMGRRDKEEERRYLYEMDEAFVPLPTLAFAPAFPLTIASLQADGLESVDPAAVVHGESEMIFHRGGAIPLNEELTSKGAITAVEDKGSGALITTTVDTFDTFGRKVFSNIFRNFARGAGGFSKEKRGKSARPPPPSLPSPSHVLLSEVVHTYDDQVGHAFNPSLPFLIWLDERISPSSTPIPPRRPYHPTVVISPRPPPSFRRSPLPPHRHAGIPVQAERRLQPSSR
mmetsp:Transcript_3240/g.6281  ORF Transcript_3240/g.6281 Transcript_3240/m.6281 type:complete len:259 (-) Transcript_3240:625-1401(-)